MVKKGLSVLALLVLAVVMMPAEGQHAASGAKPIKITFSHFWGGSNAVKPALLAAVKQFNKENPNIVVKIDTYPTDDPYYPYLAAAIASHTLPAVFFSWPGPRVKEYVQSGELLDLTKYLNEDPAWKASFVKGSLQQCQYGGIQASIPFASFAIPVFYNTVMFKEYNLVAPKTYADLMHIIKVLRAHNVIPLTACIDNGWTLGLYWNQIAHRLVGTSAMRHAYAVGDFTDPRYLQAARMLLDFRNNHAFPSDFVSLSNDQATHLFPAGKAAMYMHGTWFIGNFQGKGVPKGFINKVSFFNFPSIKGGDGSSRDWLSGIIVSLAMAKNLEKDPARLAASLKFVKYLTSPPVVKNLAEVGSKPFAIKMNPDPKLFGVLNTNIAHAVAGAANTYTLHTLASPPGFRHLLEGELSAIWLGQKTPEEAWQTVIKGTKAAYKH